MDIQVTYKREEVEKILIKDHILNFGLAPLGEMWQCSISYGEIKIWNCPIPLKADHEKITR